ncbi:hypothetical protein GPM19_08015 [Halomonas sp. ZH2S]|uniref:Uncharacterized protein n=1 Tax=Vreelandella zhuhanensis TaxID=2684210 RepID=A0A7X3H0W4_9GAMM|nr:hypothetical protein [Halomonas zhuhanensis]MWJ28149.1 hypothetical protein [Halomonas zhuhanensis]
MMTKTQIFLRVTPSQASQILQRYAKNRRMEQSRMASADLWEGEVGWLAFQCTDLAGPPTTSEPGTARHAKGVAVSFYWMGEEGYTDGIPTDARSDVLYHVFQDSLFSKKPRYQRSMIALGSGASQLLLAGVKADPLACALHWLRRDEDVAILPKRNWWPEWLRKKRASHYGFVWARWLESEGESLLNYHERSELIE